jgi:hypothetical protein
MLEALGFGPQDSQWMAQKLDAALSRVYEGQEHTHLKANHEAFRALARLTRELENPYSTPLLENWPLANGTQYRAAFLRATNDPDERRSRREIRQLLGVANGSVDTMVTRAGLEKVDPAGSYEFGEITRRRDIEKQIRHTARRVRGYPLSIISQSSSGETREYAYRGTESTPIIAETLAGGGKVNIRYQVANRYIACTEDPPQISPVTASNSTSLDDLPNKPIQRRPRRSYFGPGYDPAWLSDQWSLALIRTGRLNYCPPNTLIDQLTGEILNPTSNPPDLLTLLRLLLPELSL